MDSTLKIRMLIFFRFLIKFFNLEYVFTKINYCQAQIIKKRFRPGSHFHFGGGYIGSIPYSEKHAWLIQIAAAGKITEIEISEKFYNLLKEKDKIFIAYKTNRVNSNEIRAKILK
jgi:hypothetical protein